MTTMSKRLAMPDAMRSVQQFALSNENAQSLARAPESRLATTVECQHELTAFASMRLGKDGEAFRDCRLQESCSRDGDPEPLDRGDPAGLRRRDEQAGIPVLQVDESREPRR